jgi:hypothetical protein
MSPEPMLDATLPELERLLCNAASRRFAPRRSRRRWGVPVALFATLAVGAVAMAASGQFGDTLAGYFDGDDPPGRPLESSDSPPDWLVEDGRTGQRMLASADGYELYLVREPSGAYGFALGDSVGISDTAAGWERQFENNAVVILGPGTSPDRSGRVPLYGVTAGNVAEVEIQYQSGPASTAPAQRGGFVLMIEPAREPTELVALDRAGQPLQAVDARRFGSK